MLLFQLQHKLVNKLDLKDVQ